MNSVKRQVLVADGDVLSRKSIRQLLSLQEKLEICAEASDGPEAIKKARKCRPDLTILDISILGLEGIEACEKIREACPEAAVLAISFYDPKLVIEQMIRAQIRGFVSKLYIGSQLLPAVDAILEGGTYFRLATAKAAS